MCDIRRLHKTSVRSQDFDAVAVTNIHELQIKPRVPKVTRQEASEARGKFCFYRHLETSEPHRKLLLAMMIGIGCVLEH